MVAIYWHATTMEVSVTNDKPRSSVTGLKSCPPVTAS